MHAASHEPPPQPDDGEKTTPDARIKGGVDRKDKAAERMPAAGPHAKPHLTNEDATPGAGTLPDADDSDATGG